MPRTIQVQPGETLSGIAQRELGSASRYNELGYTGDPRKLQIGTTLTIPDQSQAKPVYQPPSTPEQSTMERIAALQQNVKELSDLKAKAQTAGLGPDQPIPDYLKTTKLEDVPRVVESQRVQTKIAELEKAGFAKPAKTYQDIYNQAFEQAGLGPVKQQISAIDERMRKVKEALFAKESEIAEDPWSSAGTKLKLTEKEYKKAQQNLELLLDERRQYAEQYTAGISAAEKVAERTLTASETAQKRALEEAKYLRGQQQEVKTQFVEVGGKRLLVNSQTGETIKDLGSTESATNWETKRLTPSEAIDYSVPLGTTWKEVADKGIVPARYKAEEPKEAKPLNILDIQRYDEIYPNAGIVAGDTETTAIQKVLQTITPRDFNDDELRSLINEVKTGNKTYEEALTAINSVAQIKNKDRAIAIANEIYGKKQGNTGQAFSETAQGLKIIAGETGQNIQEGTKAFFGQQIFDFLFKSQRNK